MFIKELLVVAAFAVGAVISAPVKMEARQAPSGVPDYVLRYGRLLLCFHCFDSNLNRKSHSKTPIQKF